MSTMRENQHYPASMQVNAEDAYKETSSYYKALADYYETELKYMRSLVPDESAQHFVNVALSRKGFTRKLNFTQCRPGDKAPREQSAIKECPASIPKRGLISNKILDEIVNDMHTRKRVGLGYDLAPNIQAVIKDMHKYQQPEALKKFHIEVGEPGNGGCVQLFQLHEGDTLMRDSAGCFVHNFTPLKRYEGKILSYMVESDTRRKTHLMLGNGDYFKVIHGELAVVASSPEVSHFPEVPQQEQMEIPLVAAKCEGEESPTYPTEQDDEVTIDHGYTASDSHSEPCCDNEASPYLGEDIADLPVGVTNILNPKNWGL